MKIPSLSGADRTFSAVDGGSNRTLLVPGADATVRNVTFGTQTGLQLAPGVGLTINAFREAYMLQTMLELDARGGTRYVEVLKAHFGVISPDFRLQRPEYLGGGQVTINCHPVAQTAPTDANSAQASLASFGTFSSSGKNIGFSKSFVEHGYVIGLACPRAAYLIGEFMKYNPYIDMVDLEPLIEKALKINDIIVHNMDKFLDDINFMSVNARKIELIIEKFRI